MRGGLTVLYDADCELCTRLAGWVARRAGVEIAPIVSATGAALLSDLTPEQRLDAVHVVDAEGRRRTAGAAVAVLAHRLPGGRVLGPLLERFPRATERGYRLLASRRRLLSRLARRIPRPARG